MSLKITLTHACASDLMVVNGARVSLDVWHEQMEKGDDKLIHFLMRERHGTPFEHGYFQFRVEAPIFVFREWQRHRVGHSYNEMSGRYIELGEDYFVPGVEVPFRVQQGKPGAYTFAELDLPRFQHWYLRTRIRWQNHGAFRTYRWLLKRGIAKEQARTVLPVATTSKMIWSCNPRSLMHFLALRTAPNAMKEIRMLATLAEVEFATFMPETHAAFVANGRRAP